MMHLTNYAINKGSDAFVENMNEADDSIGSKSSYQFVLNKIRRDFGIAKADELKAGIEDIIIKTMCMT